MIHITAQMRVLVAVEPVDGRKGIDSLVRVCQEKLSEDPISGCVFIFRSRRGTSIRLLSYDGQGYWLAQKRLSQGRFTWWPESSSAAKRLEAYEAQLLMVAGDVSLRDMVCRGMLLMLERAGQITLPPVSYVRHNPLSMRAQPHPVLIDKTPI